MNFVETHFLLLALLAGMLLANPGDPRGAVLAQIGPHWMIMWPFDPKSTGLPTRHKPAGPFIMWAGSPYAHLHVMGRP